MPSIFKKKNSFEENPQKYIKEKFNFLIEEGYKYSYYTTNGNESFCFEKDNTIIDISKNFYPCEINIFIYKDSLCSHGKSIIEFFKLDQNYIKSLSPIDSIDFLSKIIQENLNKI